MKISKIKAKNFLCFEEFELDITSFSTLQVIGNNLDEKIKMPDGEYNNGNGVGKSSIYHIITEALYSKNISGIKKNFVSNTYSNSPYKLEIEFGNGDLLTASPAACVLIDKDKNILVKGRKEVSNHFESIMPFQMFVALTYLSPKQHIPYFSDTDKYKKEFLQLLFSDLNRFLEPGDIVNNELNEKKSSLNKVSFAIETINLEETKFEELEEVKRPDNKELEALKDKKAVIYDKLKTLKGLEKVLEEKSAKFEKVKRDLKKAEDAVSKIVIQDLPTNYHEIEADIKSMKKDIEKLKDNIKNKTCPICGTEFDVYNLQEELTKLQITKEKSESLLREIKNNEKAKEELNKYNKIIADSTKQLSDNVTEEKDLREDIFLSENKLNEISEKIRILEKEYSTELTKFEEYERKRLTQEIKKEEYNNNLAKYKNLVEEERELTSNLKILDVLSVLFSSKGIFAKKLPERLSLLNESINNELSFFTNQFKLQFQLNSNGKVTEVLSKLGKEYPIENCSTGEYTRIVISLLLATRKLLSKLYKLESNLLFIDEIFGSLDATGRLLLLKKVQDENMNAIIVSHSYTDPRYPILEISKKNGVSRIKIVEADIG